MTDPSDSFLTEKELARLLRVSLSTVKRIRENGQGPPYVRVGKRAIRYERSAVLAWIRQIREGLEQR